MPDMQKRILQRKVVRDTNRMIELYALLRARTERHLHDINYDFSELLVCIMDVQHIKRISKECPLVELKAQTSVSGIFLELVTKNLISFLQFSILKRVITEICCGCQELQEQLKSYEMEFNEYIKRRVCETHIYQEGRFKAFSSSSSSEEKVELVIITDEYWNDSIQLMKVLELEELVADCLDIDQFCLEVVNIESNCLRIHYAIPLQVAKAIFPLTEEEWKKISQNHIVKIQRLRCPFLGVFYSTDQEKGIWFNIADALLRAQFSFLDGATAVDRKEEYEYSSIGNFLVGKC